MKKKLVSILLSAAMVTAVLGGCGSKPEAASVGEPAAAEENAPKEDAAPVEETTAEENAETETAEETTADPASITGEFTYWTYTDSANNLVNEFNKVYPNVTVNLQVFGGDEYKTKILTALQSGTDVPDVFDLEEGYMYEFLDSDMISDLSYINIEELTKDFYDFQVAQMKDTTGTFKCLNFQSSPVALWYLKDACEEWLGTSDPAEISAMLSDWDAIIAKGEEVYEASGGTVQLWPNLDEMPKVVAFSYAPLISPDGKMAISEDWTNLIDSMRTMYDSKADAELGSWGSEWAAAWNDGKLLFRVMPSWDFFTDWETNKGNVGVAAPFKSSYEGATGICVYNDSEKKDVAGEFLKFVASDEFQKINLESYNQIPASKKVCDEMSEGFSAEDFGGQNILATYSEICDNIVDVTPNKYTRPAITAFQKAAANGVKAGDGNDSIIEEFKSVIKDKYPEVVIE